MASVMVKCPITGKEVPTGVDMDKFSFQTARMSGNSFRCRACGQMHTWDKDQAWLEEPKP